MLQMSGIQSISVTSAQSYASVGAQNQQSLQPFANLDLTEAQRASLRAIFTNAKKTGESQADITKQVDAVLTPAQQQTLANDIKAGPGPGSGSQQQPPSFANLDLTATQSASLNAILANAKKTGESQADVKKQINAILTTTQQQTLASDIKAGPPPPQTPSPSDDSTLSSSSDSSSSASASSTDATTLATITNIQNQAAAAESARINALLAQVVGTNTTTNQ
jgi:Spy/CpxP family protein refolding chaperone